MTADRLDGQDKSNAPTDTGCRRHWRRLPPQQSGKQPMPPLVSKINPEIAGGKQILQHPWIAPPSSRPSISPAEKSDQSGDEAEGRANPKADAA